MCTTYSGSKESQPLRQPKFLDIPKHVAIILTSQMYADFVPPMKFARREGVQFVLVALGHDVHQDLLEHADFSISLA